MTKFSAIFLVFMITLNIVSSMKFTPFDASMLPSNSIRARLTSMLIEVQQTENPRTIEKFLASIRDMMTNLQEEQKKHQDISNSMMNQCTTESEFREKEIYNANNALSRSNAARQKCQSSLDTANKDLPDLKTALETYQNELTAATTHREEENEVYKGRKTDYEQAILFMKEFVNEIQSKLGNFAALSTSFAQKGEAILRHSSKLGLLTQAVPVLVALATNQNFAEHNTYNVVKNEELAAKLNKSLTDLQNRLQNDWQTNENTESAALSAFTTLKDKLEHAINTLNENLKKTEEQINAMNVCIKDETAISSEASAKLSRNTGLLDAAKSMCSTFSTEFIDATKARTEEIVMINQILEIIEKRFGSIPEDLKTYLTSVEGGFKAYTNSTEFKKFTEYVKVQISTNSGVAK